MNTTPTTDTERLDELEQAEDAARALIRQMGKRAMQWTADDLQLAAALRRFIESGRQAIEESLLAKEGE